MSPSLNGYVYDFPSDDTFFFGVDESPGQCRIVKANSPRGWDERQGYGLDGCNLIPKGDPLADVQIDIELWLIEQLRPWYDFAAKYLDAAVRIVPGTRNPQALGIYHPILIAPPIRISAVVVTDCTALLPDGLGGWGCTISLKRFKGPKPTLARPDQATPPHSAPQPTARDAAGREEQAQKDHIASLFDNLLGPQ